MAFGPGAIAGLTGVLGLIGGERANRASAREAERNRKFQERMSSSAHQREVADLRAAGLNPILSATGGSGASSPGGSMATFKDVVSPATSSALAARRMAQEIQNLKAVKLKTEADTRQTTAQTSVLSGPAGVGDWIGQLIGDFNRTAPVAGNLIRGGAKIRLDQVEDFIRNTARGSKELKDKLVEWLRRNTTISTSGQRRRTDVSVLFPDRGE